VLGLVSPGTTALVRAHVLHGDEGNLAAIYVCTVPRRRRPSRRLAGVDSGKFADLTASCKEAVRVPRAREAETHNPTKARASRGQSLLPHGGTSQLHTCPKNRAEGLIAATVVQHRSAGLQWLSPQHIRYLARPYFAAGYTPADVLYALDHDPSGRPYGYSAAVRHPAGWAAARLGRWLGPSGEPVPSRSQILARKRSRILAEQEARRRDALAAADQAA